MKNSYNNLLYSSSWDKKLFLPQTFSNTKQLKHILLIHSRLCCISIKYGYEQFPRPSRPYTEQYIQLKGGEWDIFAFDTFINPGGLETLISGILILNISLQA